MRSSGNPERRSARFQMSADRAERLAVYLETDMRFHVDRTDHWRHYGSLSSIRVDRSTSTVELHAGAGFDSEFEHNFRSRTPREVGSELVRSAAGRSVLAKFRGAFDSIWKGSALLGLDAAQTILGRPMSPHKILATHYANRLLSHLPGPRIVCYLEIGAGSGYLAALMFRLRAIRLVIVDLPEIIPYSFLYLTQRFPEASFRLPNELPHGKGAEAPDILFLAPDQMHEVADDTVDLAVNTASFGEMLPAQILDYFRFLRRVAAPGGLLFTVNRVEKQMNFANDGVGEHGSREGIAVRFRDYPWLPGDRDLYFAPSDFHALVQTEPMLSRLCELERSAPDPV